MESDLGAIFFPVLPQEEGEDKDVGLGGGGDAVPGVKCSRRLQDKLNRVFHRELVTEVVVGAVPSFLQGNEAFDYLFQFRRNSWSNKAKQWLIELYLTKPSAYFFHFGVLKPSLDSIANVG